MKKQSAILKFIVAIGIVVNSPYAFAAKADALNALLPGIVKVTTSNQNGSGIVVKVDKDAIYILTAAHVVAGSIKPRVIFFKQMEAAYPAKVVPGSELGDDDRGLAMLVVERAGNLSTEVTALPITLEYVEVVRGEEIAVLGLPQEAGDWAILHGHMVSRHGRDLTFDVSIDDGASGGALVRNGEIIGLVQRMGPQYGKGNPADSMWGFLRGMDIQPSQTTLLSQQNKEGNDLLESLPPDAPILEFIFHKEKGWSIKNIGKQPALNIVVAHSMKQQGPWLQPTQLYSMGIGENFALHWVPFDSENLLVVYKDATDRMYTRFCDDDRTNFIPSLAPLPWKQENVKRTWER